MHAALLLYNMQVALASYTVHASGQTLMVVLPLVRTYQVRHSDHTLCSLMHYNL